MGLVAARSRAARQIERGVHRYQPLADPLADHQEPGVPGHDEGLGWGRRTVREQAHGPLECLRAGHRLTRHPGVDAKLQVGQGHPLDVRRVGQLGDCGIGQGPRP